ncbi:YggT family protein [Arcanobacterium pinnipediorum]|uniref:YggT family protein n=1 Tax=Arcanobacterium pinnipediorum TaxID=1503041 RepID=A0ABY5AJK8_9ACTO|nr:YggT family protein [Arcanobacterium pinnipediorum]USR80037.1 YggT family protein [Arcanobacterium pinnipediorum]
MSYLLILLIWLCSIYTFILFARVVIDLTMTLARQWRPEGVIVVLFNIVYMLTDPPLRLVNRYIPPLRLGAVALDVGFILVFVAVRVIQNIAISFL